jgi:hypothetical protein
MARDAFARAGVRWRPGQLQHNGRRRALDRAILLVRFRRIGKRLMMLRRPSPKRNVDVSRPQHDALDMQRHKIAVGDFCRWWLPAG